MNNSIIIFKTPVNTFWSFVIVAITFRKLVAYIIFLRLQYSNNHLKYLLFVFLIFEKAVLAKWTLAHYFVSIKLSNLEGLYLMNQFQKIHGCLSIAKCNFKFKFVFNHL